MFQLLGQQLFEWTDSASVTELRLTIEIHHVEENIQFKVEGHLSVA